MIDTNVLKWKTRVVNLHGIEEKPSSGSEFLDKAVARRGIFYVELTGWSLLFTVVAAFVLQFSYLLLLLKARLVIGWSARSILIVLFSSALVYAVAEVLATYIFGNSVTDWMGVKFWANAPWLVINIVVAGYLWIRVRKFREQPVS